MLERVLSNFLMFDLTFETEFVVWTSTSIWVRRLRAVSPSELKLVWLFEVGEREEERVRRRNEARRSMRALDILFVIIFWFWLSFDLIAIV